MPGLLLQGGIFLIYDDVKNQVDAVAADVFVQDNVIVQIEPGLDAPEGCEVIDCSSSIVSPGFVDTHNHHWESPLKGLCENLTGVSYFATMFTASSALSAQDVYWGTLAGCLQSIDCGTTTTLDHAHMSWSEAHGPQALAGTLTSGIRSVFANAPSVKIKQMASKTISELLLPEWFMPSLQKLSTLVEGSLRVLLGLGFDFYFMGKEVVQNVFETARSLNLQLVTSHWAKLSTDTSPGLPSLMQYYGLSQDRVVISHFGGASARDCDTVNQAKSWYISSSPSVEMTLGLGPPVCFQDNPPLRDDSCSLGADCHCNSSSSMISEMRVALLAARGRDARLKNEKGLIPKHVCRTSQDAFLMGTIRGARALGMEDEIGSISVGKKADFAIFDAWSPAMSAAAQHDPVTAIVMHANDVRTVIVDGIICKRDGKLLPVTLEEWDDHSQKIQLSKRVISWEGVTSHIIDIQQRFSANLAQLDLEKIKSFVSSMYGMEEVQ